ncbi:MAG TPA: VapC toxin family PIN domain ribonuclease, partial [Candidatus Accumulibacter sp.]|nr:VapC toxin family PIN domain ribonuclease [Accumulibacter sp.]
MTAYLLDTSALLTLRDDEPGAARVAELLEQAQAGTVRCFGSFISLMEGLYRVWRDEGEAAGRLAHEQCLAVPGAWVDETPALLEEM